VFDETDSIESHVEDTLIAGAGMWIACGRVCRQQRPTCVQWLIDQGVLFDTQVQPNGEESYHLTREGGHSHRRILHAADATGKEVETTLVSKALNHPNIRVLERSNAVDLIISDKIGLPGTRRVVGAWIWNRNKEKWKPARRSRWCWQPAAPQRCISTPPTRISPPATVSHGLARRLPGGEPGV
jgi:L-aspartate oxidase